MLTSSLSSTNQCHLVEYPYKLHIDTHKTSPDMQCHHHFTHSACNSKRACCKCTFNITFTQSSVSSSSCITPTRNKYCKRTMDIHYECTYHTSTYIRRFFSIHSARPVTRVSATSLATPPLGVQTSVCTLVKLGKNTEKISMAPA